MRDLLTDLVRRTRRPESTVQPRVPSAYEAPPPSLHVVDEDIVTRVPAASSAPLSTREHTQPPATPRARDSHDSPAIVTTEMRSTPPASGDSVDHGARHARAAASASSDVVARTAAHVTFVPSPGRVPAAVVDAGQATPPRVPAVSVAPREARAHVVAPIQPVTRTELPQIRRVLTEPPRDGRADAREQPAPEIRISIGRIEVRATAAERPPARRQPSSPPPLTLDEYLAARARRGTR